MKKFFVYLFFNPRKRISALLGSLKPLKDGLVKFRTVTDGVEAITEFFNVVSPIQDSDPVAATLKAFKAANWLGKYNSVIERLEGIQAHIRKAGREQYGWNRTGKGEMVTDERVFLGNIYGLFTKTVAFWKTTKNDEKGEFGGFSGMEHLNCYDVVSRQATNFIKSHLPVIDLIEEVGQMA